MQNQSVLARDLNRGVQEKWFPWVALLGTPLPTGITMEEN